MAASDSSEAQGHFWVKVFSYQWLTISRIYQGTEMSLIQHGVKGNCFFYLNYFFHDPENGFAVDMCKTELFWFSLKSYFLKSCPTWKVRVISVYISWAVIVTVCRFLWGPEVEGTMWLWYTVVKLWFWQQNANLKCDSGITAAAAPFFPSTVKYTEIGCSSFFFPPSPMLSVPLR